MVKDFTYYQRLEVDSNASSVEIKKAYFRLSQLYHPDKNPPEKKDEFTKKFQEITEAKEVLLDEESRRKYDMFGLNKPDPGFFFHVFRGHHKKPHQKDISVFF